MERANTTEIKAKITENINRLRIIQNRFREEWGISDIYSNSRYFEVLIANELGHKLIGKGAGYRDAEDAAGYQYEYKHYKETSSNHTWTFNDFTDSTIEKIKLAKEVIFAHIDDTKNTPIFDWAYFAPGEVISKFLKDKTPSIKNTRKMINVSPSQLESIGLDKTEIKSKGNGTYQEYIDKIQHTVNELQELCEVKNILTSNKLWELLVALNLGHKLLSEQKQYDAIDDKGRYVEYKVSKSNSWNFEDITDNVLNRLKNERIILAVVDKTNMKIIALYEVDPIKTVERLRNKLKQKELKLSKEKKSS